MSQANTIPFHLSAKHVEEMMNVEEGSLGTLAFTALRAEAGGMKRENVAVSLGVGREDLENLILAVTQEDDMKAAEEVWRLGLIAVKTSTVAAAQMKGAGWDGVEAMAIDKLSRSLAAMKTNGKPMEMLQIANVANKAQRGSGGGNVSQKGPGGQPGNVGRLGDVEASITIPMSGDGVIHLQLSKRIQSQLTTVENPIEAGKRVSEASHNMLTLDDTRAMVDEESGEVIDASPNESLPETMEDLINES